MTATLSPGTLKTSISLGMSSCNGAALSGVGIGGIPVSTRRMRSLMLADSFSLFADLTACCWLVQVEGAKISAAINGRDKRRFRIGNTPEKKCADLNYKDRGKQKRQASQ